VPPKRALAHLLALKYRGVEAVVADEIKRSRADQHSPVGFSDYVEDGRRPRPSGFESSMVALPADSRGVTTLIAYVSADRESRRSTAEAGAKTQTETFDRDPVPGAPSTGEILMITGANG